jgi:hypothetical protein
MQQSNLPANSGVRVSSSSCFQNASLNASKKANI